MTLHSMTGFGRGEATYHGRVWTVEIRCVNNRYLDVKVKLPRDYTCLEDMIRKQIAVHHLRGRVDLSVSVSGDFSDLVEVRVDNNLAARYKQSLEELARQLELPCTFDINQLVAFPDVLIREQQIENIEDIQGIVEQAVENALVNCRSMRQQEAVVLVDDLRERVLNFSMVLDQIDGQIPQIQALRKQQLAERVEKLLGSVPLDQTRLAQELAIMADKTDVTEELVRLRSHIEQFLGLLQVDEAVGRKLDFLLQEFLREVNTLASKINDAGIAHLAVQLKSELEKMREQIQNIE